MNKDEVTSESGMLGAEGGMKGLRMGSESSARRSAPGDPEAPDRDQELSVHFHTIRENRAPCDPEWYTTSELEKLVDRAVSLQSGELQEGLAHFDRYLVAEGTSEKQMADLGAHRSGWLADTDKDMELALATEQHGAFQAYARIIAK